MRGLFQPYLKFSKSVKPILSLMDNIQNNAALSLTNHSLHAQHQTIQSGSIVLASGFLESFLRDICETYFIELAKKGVGLNILGQDFLEIHLKEGAGHLSDLVKRESRKSSSKTLQESLIFARRLVDPLNNNTLSPAWEAFARTQGNPSSETIKKILKGLGIKSGFTNLERAVNGRYSNSTIELMLTNFLELRNECAHTGISSNIPTPGQIKDTISFLRIITYGICKLVNDCFSNLTEKQ